MNWFVGRGCASPTSKFLNHPLFVGTCAHLLRAVSARSFFLTLDLFYFFICRYPF
jgi:hypothetical protein